MNSLHQNSPSFPAVLSDFEPRSPFEMAAFNAYRHFQMKGDGFFILQDTGGSFLFRGAIFRIALKNAAERTGLVWQMLREDIRRSEACTIPAPDLSMPEITSGREHTIAYEKRHRRAGSISSHHAARAGQRYHSAPWSENKTSHSDLP